MASLLPLNMLFAFMRKTSALYGNIPIGEPKRRKYDVRAGWLFPVLPQWPTMNTAFSGIFTSTARFSLLTALTAAIFMVIPLIGSVYPVPLFPYNILPYAFAAYVVVGLWLYHHRRDGRMRELTGVNANTQELRQ